jgi:acetate kinase
MADAVAVLNAGSSSFKFSLFSQGADDLTVVVRGQAEGLYTAPRFVAKDVSGAIIEEKSWDDGSTLGHAGALDHLVAFVRQHLVEHRLVGVGHRVVHGAHCSSERRTFHRSLASTPRFTAPSRR